MSTRITTQQVQEQLERYLAFIGNVDLDRITCGYIDRIRCANKPNAADLTCRRYQYIRRVLKLANVGHGFYKPHSDYSYHQLLEREISEHLHLHLSRIAEKFNKKETST